MRIALAPLALISTIGLATTSIAQLSIGFDRNDKPRLLCKAWTGNDNVVLGTSEVVNNPKAKDRYAYHARKYGESIGTTIYTDCLSFEGITDDYRATFTPGSSFQNYEKETVTVVEAPFLPQGWESTPTPDEGRKASAKGKPDGRAKAGTASGDAAKSDDTAAQQRAERARLLREENETIRARNKADAEAHQRELTAYEVKKAAHEQMLADHRASIAKASAERAAHDLKLAEAGAAATAHEKKMEEYRRQVAGEASTNDDPNRCISSAAVKPGLRGNTEASVTNACEQKVDIVICFKRTEGDWSCGARFGILPGRAMTHQSTNATGEVYVDAVTYGSKNKLGRPSGVIR